MSKTSTSFKPGEGGRPKGALNKIKQDRQDKIQLILSVGDDMVEEAMRKLKPKELLDIWVTLNEFLCPKMQRITLDTDAPEDKISKITFELVSAGGAVDEPNVKTGNG